MRSEVQTGTREAGLKPKKNGSESAQSQPYLRLFKVTTAPQRHQVSPPTNNRASAVNASLLLDNQGFVSLHFTVGNARATLASLFYFAGSGPNMGSGRHGRKRGRPHDSHNRDNQLGVGATLALLRNGEFWAQSAWHLLLSPLVV